MKRKIYIETYGCQMNLADTEIIHGILEREGYEIGDQAASADAIFLNTCSVREHAEQRVYGRLAELSGLKKRNPHLVLGVLGCMAARLRGELASGRGMVDVVCGPDEYRRLPELIDGAFHGHTGVRTRLSRIETYDDLVPVRSDAISAWLPIMRGCDKFCAYCVVPYVRGRERSRPLAGILEQIRALAGDGCREVTLLGQNVNSWRDGDAVFADLLLAAARAEPSLRIRFTTSHPGDMSDRLVEALAAGGGICPWLHLPVQSGSDRMLERMNRGYSRERYLDRVRAVAAAVPGIALSTDIIAGFPTETEEDHEATLALLRQVRFDSAFTFKYSPREGTRAFSMPDDVPDEVKGRRLEEIIALQRSISYERNSALVGATVDVLLEGHSKRSRSEWMGRTDTNKTVVVPEGPYRPGDMLRVAITSATSATLFGSPVAATPGSASRA